MVVCTYQEIEDVLDAGHWLSRFSVKIGQDGIVGPCYSLKRYILGFSQRLVSSAQLGLDWNLFFWIVFSMVTSLLHDLAQSTYMFTFCHHHILGQGSDTKLSHTRCQQSAKGGTLTQKRHTQSAKGDPFDTKVSHVVPIQTFRCLDVSVDQLWLSRWPRAYQGVGYNWDISGLMMDTNDDKTWSNLLSPWLSWRVASRSFRVASSSSTFYISQLK